MAVSPRTRDRWRWRRTVVLALTILGIVLPFIQFVNPEVYWPVYTVIGSVVSAYIGFATVDDRWNKGHPFPVPVRSRRGVDDPD